MTGTGPSAPVPPVLVMSAGRALYGLALLAVPGPMLAAVSGEASNRRDRAVARVLGARHITQAVVSAVAGRPALTPGAVVDSLHAASMVGLAARRSTPQRAELADAAVASLLAILGVVLG
jgi:threonine/homoserine/homoserine lactone efflux protein